MSPKLMLWLAFASLSSIWYVLDPDAGGPFVGRLDPAVTVTAPALKEPIALIP
jgi:hypothetical protein